MTNAKSFIRLLVLCIGLLTVPAALAQQLIGDTGAPFSADRTVTYRGKVYTGKVYAVPGKQRHEVEISGFHPVAILLADRKIAYVMLPELHVYAEFPFTKAVAEYDSSDQLGTPEATDTVSGQAASRYKIDHPGSDGSLLAGLLWRTDDGIVVKADGAYTPSGGKPTAGTVTLSNVKRGPQDKSLFELPHGMAKLDLAAIEPLLNLRTAKPKP